MFRRFFFFAIMNIAIIAAITIVTSALGLNSYMTEYGINYASLLGFCLVWGMVGSFIGLLMSKFMAKRMMGVEIVDENSEYGNIVRRVHQYAQTANLPKMPEVGIYQSEEVNAFATGPSKANSLVAVSTGLLNSMNEEEVNGVLAHEVAHIANGDMVTMTLIQGVINSFVMFFARIAAFAVQNAMRSDNDDRPAHSGGILNFVLIIAFQILFGFIGMFVVAYFSRQREFRADAGGALYAGKSSMVNALRKLQGQQDGYFNPDTDSMNAMKISTKNKGLMALRSTHPPLEERIQRLQETY